MVKRFDIGDVVKTSGSFKVSTILTDPSTVYFAYSTPSRNSGSYLYGTDTELVRSGTGRYYVNIPASEAGTWRWRFVGTGSAAVTEEGMWHVNKSRF